MRAFLDIAEGRGFETNSRESAVAPKYTPSASSKQGVASGGKTTNDAAGKRAKYCC
jgi:hypothetical protein